MGVVQQLPRCRSCCTNRRASTDRSLRPPLLRCMLAALACSPLLVLRAALAPRGAVPLPQRARRAAATSRARWSSATSRRRPHGPRAPRSARRAPGEPHVVAPAHAGAARSATARASRRRAPSCARGPGVLSATPNYVAHISGWVPPDPGSPGSPRRLAAAAVELPGRDRASTRPTRGSTCIAVGRPGGAGVDVAVLDTGVAYADRGRFRALAGLLAVPLRQGLGLRRRRPVPERRQRPRHARRGHDRRGHRQRRRRSPGSPTARRSCR